MFLRAVVIIALSRYISFSFAKYMWILLSCREFLTVSALANDIVTLLFPRPVDNVKRKFFGIPYDLFNTAIDMAGAAYHTAGSRCLSVHLAYSALILDHTFLLTAVHAFAYLSGI